MADDIQVVIGVDDTSVLQSIDRVSKLERGYKKLDAAFNKGKLSPQQYAKGVQQLDNAMARATTSANTFGKAQIAATKASNRMGVVTQQAGYQVSDFIVQIQSGTNPFVAFSQQASQLAGVLPLVADRLGMTAARAIAVSAALGVGIPVIGMLGAAFLNSSRSAKTFEDAIDKAESALGDLLDTMEDLEDNNFTEKFGSLSSSMRNISIDAAKFNTELAKIESNKAIALLTGDLDLDRSIGEQFLALINPFATADPSFDVQMKLREMGFNRASGVNAEDFAEIQKLYSDNNFVGAVQKIESLFADTAKSGSVLSDEALKLMQDLYRAATNAADLQASMDGTAQHALAMKNLSELEQDLLPLPKLLDKSSTSLSHWGDLLGLTHDEIDAAVDRAEYMKDVYDALGQEATPTLVKASMDFYDETKKAEGAVLAMADAIDDAKDAFEDLSGIDTDLDEELNKVKIQLDLLEQGKDKETAAFIAGEKAKVLAAYETTKALALQTNNVVLLAEATLTMLDALDKIEELSGYKDKLSDLTSSGPKKETGKQYAESQLREAQNKRLIASLTKDQASYEEVLFKLQEANAKKRDPLSEKEIQDYARKIQGLNKQTEALKEQKRVQQELTEFSVRAFGDAFLEIGKGTKSVEDAFREMAANIIQELYRVLVVKKMVAAATSFFGFADGGVFSNGNVVPFANGGVVGGPTVFPMAGGKTGLMGEAGPEAIMPLKRGKDGKLGVSVDGQSDTVVVNNHFNFAANGDDSVKRIIVQSMPQITEAAKAGVLDARKRGGSFRKVFS